MLKIDAFDEVELIAMRQAIQSQINCSNMIIETLKRGKEKIDETVYNQFVQDERNKIDIYQGIIDKLSGRE